MSIILVSPVNDANIVGNVLVFEFTIPTDSYNLKLVFRLALDRNNPPDPLSSHYKKHESRFSLDNKQNGIWSTWNGSSWIQMPTGGVGSSFYGVNAKVEIRKQDTTNYPDVNLQPWYWEISSGEMPLHSIYNEATFGQNVFGV